MEGACRPTYLEAKSIKGPRNDKGSIIKPAEKGAAIVILKRSDYLKEGYKHLTDPLFYRHVEEDLTKNI